ALDVGLVTDDGPAGFPRGSGRGGGEVVEGGRRRDSRPGERGHETEPGPAGGQGKERGRRAPAGKARRGPGSDQEHAEAREGDRREVKIADGGPNGRIDQDPRGKERRQHGRRPPGRDPGGHRRASREERARGEGRG